MRLSTTMSLYIGRQFIVSFLAIFTILLTLILLVDVIELLRRAASKPQVNFAMVMEMAVLKLPHMGQQLFPFAILFGGMSAFWRLTRNHELVVSRAAGVSAWQFLLPVLVLAFILGIVKISIFNPLASTMLTRFERVEAAAFKGQESFLALSSSGLWLRQSDGTDQSVIHAKSFLQQGKEVELGAVNVFIYKGVGEFIKRIDASGAILEDGFWHMNDVWIHQPDVPSQHEEEFWLETDLTLGSIQDNFAPPETMSFWDLPAFIETLEGSGFSAVRHRLHWHSLLAAPLLMCAMVLIAATFTLRHARRGGTVFVISGGVLTGFVLYFFSDVVFALGLSDSIPVTLAAWTPSGVTLLLGLAMLLHLEDG
ncbi:MAG: LPS export ABC transporter permease LptG [Rhodospirillaceae bacterium]|jgi:lipopolysaccharide export system permease protein|nr:LPS export ABC transporter permease LptG [Rhodospirillaceae bacterium]MBT5244212.1 LPS export ABC transporter permease LptG [Rhodospirillaceae bacterium]MBT5561737.1 LPS export ABC transporter permease LptG [Rhodospirillaceae bacterium]MBT6243176.1 LPS export ABC transporter permease LptG [Rhodospirillaceae bacterium]MBT7137431.1 LPS export ABC transporter permease LptG [Rhodospirillaceae bacterium]